MAGAAELATVTAGLDGGVHRLHLSLPGAKVDAVSAGAGCHRARRRRALAGRRAEGAGADDPQRGVKHPDLTDCWRRSAAPSPARDRHTADIAASEEVAVGREGRHRRAGAGAGERVGHLRRPAARPRKCCAGGQQGKSGDRDPPRADTRLARPTGTRRRPPRPASDGKQKAARPCATKRRQAIAGVVARSAGRRLDDSWSRCASARRRCARRHSRRGPSWRPRWRPGAAPVPR